jgi:2-polyprenyl-3-methyl-5-hydroxy-6-metoxy-1,4-benzoquinol methylase
LEPRPAAAEIAGFYTRYYTHASAGDRQTAPPRFSGRGVSRLLRRLLAWALPWKRAHYLSDNRYLAGLPAGRLLDVGCGSGDFLHWMARLGWQAHGIDFDEAAVRAAGRFPGVDVRLGDLNSQNFSADYFDAITLSDVIEHLPNPEQVIRECLRILRPGGRIVIATPNIDSFGHRFFGRHWRGLEPPRHLFLYSASALKKMAKLAGFERFSVFSTPGNKLAHDYIITASEEAATPVRRPYSRRARSVLARILEVFGVHRGEWIVFVGTK